MKLHVQGYNQRQLMVHWPPQSHSSKGLLKDIQLLREGSILCKALCTSQNTTHLLAFPSPALSWELKESVVNAPFISDPANATVLNTPKSFHLSLEEVHLFTGNTSYLSP